jgi:hypothetical protein
METLVIKIPENILRLDRDDIDRPFGYKFEQYLLSEDDWIRRHASGTLRKNKSIGFSYRSQYLDERIAYQFGWGFRILPRSKVTFGCPITEGDNHAITEAGWHIERYINTRAFSVEKFSAKYITAEEPEGRKEGIGIFVEETIAQWVPLGHVVYAIVAEYDPIRKMYRPALNPF